MTMTKADMVKIICEKMGFALKESTEIVEWVFEIMKENLEGGEKVKISGFGNFVIRAKRPRRGRNPKTGEEMVISGRRVVTFKASPVLRKALNQGVSSSKLSGGSQERFNETEDLEGEQVRGEMTTDLPVSQDGLPVLLVNDEPFSPEEAEFFIEYAAQEELEILREGGYDLRQRT